MKQIPVLALALAIVALGVFSWMFRYDVSGHFHPNESFRYDASSGKQQFEMKDRPVMLDRWTGKTYFYYSNVSGAQVTGAWQEMGPRIDAERRAKPSVTN